MKINQSLLDSFKTMVEDAESLDGLESALDGIADHYIDALSDEISEKRAELTDDAAPDLASASAAEVIDLLDARPDVMDAVRQSYFSDEESEEEDDAGDEEQESEPDTAEDDAGEEESDTDDGKDDTESKEDDDKSREDGQEDGDGGDEDTDNQEGEETPESGDEDDEQEDASDLDDLTILDDDEFDAESAADRLAEYADDHNLPDAAYLVRDGEAPRVPVADVRDGELVLSRTALRTARERVEDQDLSDEARESALGVLARTKKVARAEDAEEAVRKDLVEAAERMGIDGCEDMTLSQLSVAINDVSGQSGTGVTDEQEPFTARDAASRIIGRSL